MKTPTLVHRAVEGRGYGKNPSSNKQQILMVIVLFLCSAVIVYSLHYCIRFTPIRPFIFAEEENARYILSALSQIQAAIIGIVFSLNLVIIQLKFKHNDITPRSLKKDIMPNLLGFIFIVFVISIVFDLVLIKFADKNININIFWALLFAVFVILLLAYFVFERLFDIFNELIINEIITGKASGMKLSGVEMANVDLSETNLEDADLSTANLEKANLKKAILRNTILNGSNLKYAYLWGADLEYANLREANLKGASLSNTNLKHSDLSDADLEDANLSGANLEYANLSGANLINIEYDQDFIKSLARAHGLKSVNMDEKLKNLL